MDNKNHLKNINEQNFEHFMRGYDKGFYGNMIDTDEKSVHITTTINLSNSVLENEYLISIKYF